MEAGNSTVAVSRLKREDCERTKNDSRFSNWKILVGPSDWDDHLLGKEGAERYRVHNLPQKESPGVYELGVSGCSSLGRESGKLDPGCVVPVYLGQADNARTRLQQYGRSGAHLGNGSSTDHPTDCVRKEMGRGLFEDILSRGYPIVYRWAPMENKSDALKTENQPLDMHGIEPIMEQGALMMSIENSRIYLQALRNVLTLPRSFFLPVRRKWASELSQANQFQRVTNSVLMMTGRSTTPLVGSSSSAEHSLGWFRIEALLRRILV